MPKTVHHKALGTVAAAALLGLVALPRGAVAQDPAQPTVPQATMFDFSTNAQNAEGQPWMDRDRSPDERADLVLAQMTLDEKIGLLHGSGFLEVPATSNGGAGYTPGVPRLGIPDLNLADSTVGVTRGASRSRYATLMPATIAEASTWSEELAYDYAALVGQELRDQGYNVSLAGGANLAREPRNGRTFEYRGEDPLLTGVLAAHAIRGMQDQNVIGDLKHYALNDQETGRHTGNVEIDYRAARESDLLAFEIAVREGRPGMVMCAYNLVWGEYACESDRLLNQILKREWGFEGWVISDWGATHSAERALMAGLDQEQPNAVYFGAPLKAAVLEGRVPEAAVDAAARRILRTMFAVGVIDNPPRSRVVDIRRGLRVAQRVEEQGAVLLKNDGNVLPLENRRRIAVVGGHADVGVLTGAGSGQVDPPGGNAAPGEPSETRITPDGQVEFGRVWWPSSPLEALRSAAPGTEFIYDDGRDPARARAVADSADAVLVFAYAPSSEERDNPTLGLPGQQDALISAVAGADAPTVVILQTTGPVTMPWIDEVEAVVSAWFPGAAGGEALANLLTGRVNFTGKLPITFPRSEADLPHPQIRGANQPLVPLRDSIIPNMMTRAPFDIVYDEGVLVGYKWFEATDRTPLFAFGHGLSYTAFAYADLETTPDGVTFSVTNTGRRAGIEIAQVYVSLPEDVRLAPRQLAGWARVNLQPGETRRVTVAFHELAVSMYDTGLSSWRRPAGRYGVWVGGSSQNTPLAGAFARD